MRKTETITSLVGVGIAGILLLAVVFIVVSFVTMLVWNFFIPELFGLPALSFWQALGICLLGRLISGAGTSSSSSS